MINIGIAEDDIKIAALIKKGLEELNYEVSVFSNGEDALSAFQKNSFDLLILDIMMPGINGIEICQRIRTVNKVIPILMLTAMGSVDDKVLGLNTGADDYLVKPFHFRELLARIEVLLRRHSKEASPVSGQILHFEDMTLNVYSKEVQRAGIPIELTAKEFTLLELFMRNPNRLLSRQYIAENAWDINFDTGTNVIDVYVNFLRKKIEKGFEKKLIHTRINMGYILKT
jgi:two-component system copper resistance phosphate regulon response regulator CusR